MNLPTRITAQALLGLMLFATQDARAESCESTRQDLDVRISEAATEDPRHDRLTGSRWLRQSPFLHAELLAANDARSTRAVLDAMANLDRSALELELGKTAQDVPSQDCWKQAVDQLLSTADALTELRSEEPADHYRRWPRALGPYTIARPFLRQGAARWRSRERAAIAKGRAPVRLAFAPPAATDGARAAGMAALRQQLHVAQNAHPLGWPELNEAQLASAFALFAPALRTSDTRDHGRIGRLEGRAGRPFVDTSTPTGYTEASYVRHRGEVLLQLTYTFWFTERPRTGVLDPYGGPVDGLVLRTTLAMDGRPLLWESIHPCGCYYTVFLPADRSGRYENPENGSPEPAMVLPGPKSDAPIALHYTPDTHYLRFMTDAREERIKATSESYALARYDMLLESGPARPPFRPDGILHGTARGERWFLWPSGVRNPGAMRSSGRQATAFLGTRTFDRAELLGGRLLDTEQ